MAGGVQQQLNGQENDQMLIQNMNLNYNPYSNLDINNTSNNDYNQMKQNYQQTVEVGHRPTDVLNGFSGHKPNLYP